MPHRFGKTIRCEHCNKKIDYIKKQQPVWVLLDPDCPPALPYHANCWSIERGWLLEVEDDIQEVDNCVVARGSRDGGE